MAGRLSRFLWHGRRWRSTALQWRNTLPIRFPHPRAPTEYGVHGDGMDRMGNRPRMDRVHATTRSFADLHLLPSRPWPPWPSQTRRGVPEAKAWDGVSERLRPSSAMQVIYLTHSYRSDSTTMASLPPPADAVRLEHTLICPPARCLPR